MKKLLLIALFLFFITVIRVDASGFCSGHGGVSCKAGAQSNGHIICSDGFKGSSGMYSQVKECKSTNTKNTTNKTSAQKSSVHKTTKKNTAKSNKTKAKKVAHKTTPHTAKKTKHTSSTSSSK